MAKVQSDSVYRSETSWEAARGTGLLIRRQVLPDRGRWRRRGWLHVHPGDIPTLAVKQCRGVDDDGARVRVLAAATPEWWERDDEEDGDGRVTASKTPESPPTK